jgi:hypothetical protein
MGDKITTHGYRVLTSVEYTTIMIVELAVISGLGSSLEYKVWFGNGKDYMKPWIPIGTSVLLITPRPMDNRESKSHPKDMLRVFTLQYGRS